MRLHALIRHQRPSMLITCTAGFTCQTRYRCNHRHVSSNRDHLSMKEKQATQKANPEGHLRITSKQRGEDRASCCCAFEMIVSKLQCPRRREPGAQAPADEEVNVRVLNKAMHSKKGFGTPCHGPHASWLPLRLRCSQHFSTACVMMAVRLASCGVSGPKVVKGMALPTMLTW